ncbi:hypothetical protein [Bradyrhizobium ottawaense]|uniref:hypothetical protein n=1 Tax=Bradyrhizobium ottawaense TaxID=931866 RepID=UPI003836CC39
MKQKSGPRQASADQVLKDIRRQTRRQYSAEEKIRIVLEGLRGANDQNLVLVGPIPVNRLAGVVSDTRSVINRLRMNATDAISSIRLLFFLKVTNYAPIETRIPRNHHRSIGGPQH